MSKRPKGIAAVRVAAQLKVFWIQRCVDGQAHLGDCALDAARKFDVEPWRIYEALEEIQQGGHDLVFHEATGDKLRHRKTAHWRRGGKRSFVSRGVPIAGTFYDLYEATDFAGEVG